MEQVRRHRRSKRDGERQGKPAAERKRKKKIELSTTENEDEPERIGSRQGLPSNVVTGGEGEEMGIAGGGTEKKKRD
jgi:hypothetical protein